MSIPAKIANELNSSEMLRFLGWLMLGLGLLVLVLRPLVFPDEPYLWGGDYSTFWAASWLAMHDGLAQLYGTRMLENIPTLTAPAPPWFYPPPMLLLAYPAAALPFLFSYTLFSALSLILAVAIWRLWNLRKLHLLLLLAAPATLLNLLYGQNGLLMAAIWIGGLLLLQKNAFLAGCILGLLVIKPQLAVLAPLLLAVGGYWRALAGFTFSAVMLFNLSWLAFGPDMWIDFILNAAAVGQLMQSGTLIDVTKIGSLYMGARMAGAGHTEALVIHVLFALAAISICCRVWARPDVPFGHKAAAALIAALMITPYQFIYDLTLLLGAIAFWHQANGDSWRGIDRLCNWLLWLAPFLAQGFATALGIGCLPAILLLSLWRISISPSAETKPA